MGYILRDVECKKCGVIETLLDKEEDVKCSKCSNKAEIIFSFSGKIVGCDSFNPHYDIQLGKYFESADHKKRVLTEMGRVQETGTPSPRKSREDRKMMSKTQYLRGVLNNQIARPRRQEKPNL